MVKRNGIGGSGPMPLRRLKSKASTLILLGAGLGGSCVPWPSECEKYSDLPFKQQQDMFRTSAPDQQVDLYLCGQELYHPRLNLLDELVQSGRECIPILMDRLVSANNDERRLAVLRALHHISQFHQDLRSDDKVMAMIRNSIADMDQENNRRQAETWLRDILGGPLWETPSRELIVHIVSEFFKFDSMRSIDGLTNELFGKYDTFNLVLPAEVSMDEPSISKLQQIAPFPFVLHQEDFVVSAKCRPELWPCLAVQPTQSFENEHFVTLFVDDGKLIRLEGLYRVENNNIETIALNGVPTMEHKEDGSSARTHVPQR